MRRVASRCLLLLVASMPMSIATAQQPSAAGAGRATASTHAADALMPGDVVRLRIWREPDLSGDFTIDENGAVTLPKVGTTRVVGEPIDSLRARLVRAYEAFLREPSMEVIPLRRIRVTGAVRNPGLYTVDPTMSVADALALAGGATPQGKRDRVVLIRGGASHDTRLSPLDGTATLPLRSGDQLFVPERSWVSRNPGVVIGAVSAAASMMWAISRLGR